MSDYKSVKSEILVVRNNFKDNKGKHDFHFLFKLNLLFLYHIYLPGGSFDVFLPRNQYPSNATKPITRTVVRSNIVLFIE